jgi:superfamily I DNA and/or RNA helicase
VSSFFNTAEVYEVIKYARKILSSTFNGKHLCQSDIGVVSPYRGQLQKISRTLRNNGMPDICVGSVEEFQGQERRVIIISTVRSNPAQLKLDQKFSLGFVREPRVRILNRLYKKYA